jgi:hypothetical protein
MKKSARNLWKAEVLRFVLEAFAAHESLRSSSPASRSTCPGPLGN